MQNDHVEPAPVASLAYRNNEPVPVLLSIIRILAILCIIDGSISLSGCALQVRSLFQSSFWVVFLARNSGNLLEKVSAVVIFLECLASAAIEVGAIGCLYRREKYRRLLVIAYCCSAAILVLLSIINLATFYLRRPANFVLIAGFMGQIFTALIFPLASVLIFSNSGIRKEFED